MLSAVLLRVKKEWRLGMNPLLSEVSKVFFEAMLNGWVNPNATKGTMAQLPGSKLLVFKKGEHTVKDFYVSNEAALTSMGNTIIWKGKTPFWMMSYGGHYPKYIIPFLKKALLAAYSEGQFFGGRGPEFYEDDMHVYINTVMKNDFGQFLGEEKVIEKTGRRLIGWHHYWGMALTFRS